MDELAKLNHAVEKYYPRTNGAWKKISQDVGTRDPIQCFHKHARFLDPETKQVLFDKPVPPKWTSIEDALLLSKSEGLSSWHSIAKSISPLRTDQQCLKRYLNLTKNANTPK